MTNIPNKRDITGWLRDGLTSLPAKVTGNIIKRSKTGLVLLEQVEYKNLKRWYVSKVAGLADRGRGFYRSRTTSGLTGRVFRRNKLTDIFNIIYGQVLQAGNTVDTATEYGRHYQYDCNTDLSLGGNYKDLSMNENIVIYNIPAQFGKETVMWEDITNDEIYEKQEEINE
jgi:hypothetical protein